MTERNLGDLGSCCQTLDYHYCRKNFNSDPLSNFLFWLLPKEVRPQRFGRCSIRNFPEGIAKFEVRGNPRLEWSS